MSSLSVACRRASAAGKHGYVAAYRHVTHALQRKPIARFMVFRDACSGPSYPRVFEALLPIRERTCRYPFALAGCWLAYAAGPLLRYNLAAVADGVAHLLARRYIHA